jgi:hypothetical protein
VTSYAASASDKPGTFTRGFPRAWRSAPRAHAEDVPTTGSYRRCNANRLATRDRPEIAAIVLTMQKLVLFDLDDTLVDRRTAFNAWAEEFAGCPWAR